MILVIELKKNSITKIYFVTFFLFLMDFISKSFIVRKVDLLKSVKIIPNFFYITYLQNKGAAWGIFANSTTILALISLIFFVLISNYVKKIKNMSMSVVVAFSLLLGGILGNFVDRIIHGYVIDFLDFRIFGYNYPVFNLADVMIVTAIILIIYLVVKGEIDANSSK